ncbi:hypothetical protein Ddye_009596 [Dipteronia dyeriana]|uniref:Uncharacterized protein n=1 Tax=Dipteronia dyeriana TaxID=168575 RepID=A0AAE0CMI0_9ROSI|nr:hypothetical protein Ddye_009596 [Dipteronia dyeriana]
MIQTSVGELPGLIMHLMKIFLVHEFQWMLCFVVSNDIMSNQCLRLAFRNLEAAAMRNERGQIEDRERKVNEAKRSKSKQPNCLVARH